MKPQFSPIPREVDKFISALDKANAGVGSDFDEVVKHLIGTIQPKLREATHFELPPREMDDFGGHYTAEDILAVCEPELKLPYPVVSLFRMIGGQPILIVAWDKPMWIEKREEIGNIIHTYALARVDDVWYPAQGVLLLDPSDVLVVAYLKERRFAMWHTYGWTNSKATRDSEGRLTQKWLEEVTRDIVELCALLRMPACKLETQRESRLKAKIGAKKAKPKAFYDVHRVVIDRTTNVQTPSEPKGGTHASPRWHKRRGYWRHMKKSGKVVWVQACEVGKKSNGMVYKDYEIVGITK